MELAFSPATKPQGEASAVARQRALLMAANADESVSAIQARGAEPRLSAAVGGAMIYDERRAAALVNVLVTLDAAFYEDYEELLCDESRAGFESFMKYHRWARMPLLGSESTGKIVGTWKSGDECLSIRFVERHRFHYAITTRGQDGLRRDWGHSNIVTFFDEHPSAKRLVRG